MGLFASVNLGRLDNTGYFEAKVRASQTGDIEGARGRGFTLGESLNAGVTASRWRSVELLSAAVNQEGGSNEPARAKDALGGLVGAGCG